MSVHLNYKAMSPRIILALGLLFLISACGSAIPFGEGNGQQQLDPSGQSNKSLQSTEDPLATRLVSRQLSQPDQIDQPRSDIMNALRPAPVATVDSILDEAAVVSESNADPNAEGPIETTIPTGNAVKQYYISGFACTGSMRPALDCGDEGLFLKPPFTEPLQVGDIISFTPTTACRYYKNHNVAKAHRIIGVRMDNDVPFFTTQGDTSANADPCEVIMEQIDGKLVETRKGVRPQDIIDTSEYDAAKDQVASLKALHEEMKADYNARRAEYNALVEEYEALIVKSQITQEEVNQTYQVVDSEVKSLNQMSQELNLLGTRINEAINQVDLVYQRLFTN